MYGIYSLEKHYGLMYVICCLCEAHNINKQVHFLNRVCVNKEGLSSSARCCINTNKSLFQKAFGQHTRQEAAYMHCTVLCQQSKQPAFSLLVVALQK